MENTTIKVNAYKDGKGNVVITENSFELLLGCLDNQKFIHESPTNGDSMANPNYKSTQQEIQEIINEYNKECRNILHQRLVIYTKSDGYYLTKKYENQDDLLEWTTEDVLKIKELFKDTEISYVKPENLLPLDGTENIMEGTNPIGKDERGFLYCEPTEKTPWLIERSLFNDYMYITISEDGKNNRPWKQEEFNQIKEIFNSK